MAAFRVSCMYSQTDVFRPILRRLDKFIEEVIPRFLDDILETRILLFIDYLYTETSLTTPEKK
jgi:hypothetical protein